MQVLAANISMKILFVEIVCDCFVPLKEGWLWGAFLHNSQTHGYFFPISSELGLHVDHRISRKWGTS